MVPSLVGIERKSTNMFSSSIEAPNFRESPLYLKENVISEKMIMLREPLHFLLDMVYLSFSDSKAKSNCARRFSAALRRFRLLSVDQQRLNCAQMRLLFLQLMFINFHLIEK